MQRMRLLALALLLPLAALPARAQHVPPAYPGQLLPVDSGPSDIAFGDVDGDGWPDVVVACFTGNSGTLLLSDGHGSLHVGSILNLGLEPAAVALADVDEDGHLDLLALNRGTSLYSLYVKLGDGQGGFAPAAVTLLGSSGQDLLVADANEDGHLDLVITAISPNRLFFAAGAGDGSFGPLTQLPMHGNQPADVATADFDHDGHLDLLVAFRLSHDLWTLLGDGEGGFTAGVHLIDLDETVALAVGLLDDDAEYDVVVLTDVGGGDLGWFEGNGGGTFLPRKNLPTEVPPTLRDVDLGDFDGDGDLDVVAGGSGSYHLGLTLQTAPGVFAADPVWIHSIVTHELGVADLDHDGIDDVVSGNSSFGRASIFLSHSAPLEMKPESYTTNPDPRGIDVGDLDGDGHDDVVGVGTTLLAQEYLMVLAGQADGSLGTPTLFPVVSNGDPSKDSLVLHDLDGDGHLDVAFIDETGFKVIVRRGDGQLGFLPQQTYWMPPWPTFIVAGDVTGDGVPDLVTVHEGQANVSVLPGVGGGEFGAPISLAVAAEPAGAAIGDFDGDGDGDVAIAHDQGQCLTLLSSGGGGSFTSSVIPSPVPLRAVAAADFDGDGRVDLAAGGTDLQIYLGDGAGGFALASSQPALTGSQVQSLRVADVDRDSHLDLVAGLTGAVAWVRNTGAGSFEAPRCHLAKYGSGPLIAIGDLSGRGGVDIVTGTKEVGVLHALIVGPWSNLGHPLAGSLGDPHLYAEGSLAPSSPLKLLLDAAAPSALSALVLGLSVANVPFKGGTMVPFPNVLLPGLATNASGKLNLSATWPAAVPSGLTVVLQHWIVDGSGPVGFTASNGIGAETP
jgi:hypothetical protein